MDSLLWRRCNSIEAIVLFPFFINSSLNNSSPDVY
jgi:hypothetical protein